jgi:hypothetical protein
MQLVCIRQRDDIPGVEVPDLESSRIVLRAIRVALQRGFDALGVRPSCIVHKVVVLHWLHACVAPGDLVPIAKIGLALRLASCFMVPGEGRHHDFEIPQAEESIHKEEDSPNDDLGELVHGS